MSAVSLEYVTGEMSYYIPILRKEIRKLILNLTHKSMYFFHPNLTQNKTIMRLLYYTTDLYLYLSFFGFMQYLVCYFGMRCFSKIHVRAKIYWSSIY